MSNAQRSMHYARALLRAFKKDPSRVARGAVRETAPAKPMRECSRPSALQSLRDSDLHLMNSFQKVRISEIESGIA